jgi:hypothetical protein
MRATKIDAVELVRGIREAHYTALQGKSAEEKIAFFREKARALHAELGRPEEILRSSSERRPTTSRP